MTREQLKQLGKEQGLTLMTERDFSVFNAGMNVHLPEWVNLADEIKPEQNEVVLVYRSNGAMQKASYFMITDSEGVEHDMYREFYLLGGNEEMGGYITDIVRWAKLPEWMEGEEQ